MIKRFLKTLRNTLVFLVITGIVFSNVPFNVFTSLIDTYEKTSGIVDKIWKLEQSHDENVVDKFASIRNTADKFKIHTAMAVANYQAAGTWQAGTGALTVPWPAHQVNDVALLFIENANSPISLTTPAGFTEITSSPMSTGTLNTAGGVRLGVYWARATSSSMASPVVAAATNHQTARIITFRGIIESGNPWDATPTVTVKSTASTTNTFPSITTTAANDVIVLAAALDLDANSTATSTVPTNANLTSIAELNDQTVNTGVGGGLVVSKGIKATAGATGTSASTVTSTIALLMTIALKPQLTTTLSNFVTAEPGDSTIAPGASAAVDSFGFSTMTGTDTITAATVGLAAGMGQYVQTVAITNSTGGTTYCSGAPTGDTATLSGCAIPVTTTNTEFDIKITAIAHGSMPAPPGNNYGVTATITGWTGTNATHAGTDSGSSTVTIDNGSPGGTTGATATPGDTSVDVAWTNPGDADFQKVIIYCKTAAITEAPTEGSDPAVDGTACNGTAKVKYSGATSPQTFSGLTNGTTYYFRIYARDTNGNFTAYSSTEQVSATPTVPAATITMSNFVGGEPGDFTIAPGASAQVDSFGIVASAGTDTLTDAIVTMTTGMGQYISNVALTNDLDTVTYCNATPSGDTATFSGCTLPVTTTNTQYKVRLTAKAHNLMPIPNGGTYSIGATVTSWTVTGIEAGSDTGSSTTTIDNLSPNGATAISGTAGNTANTIDWTTSSSSDFDTTNGSVVLRWASSTAGSEVPAEGTSSYAAGATIGTATIACVISSAVSTAESKTDGTGGSAGCTTTALTNGQAYTYKVFERDTNGNYDTGVSIGTFTPVAVIPTLTTYTNSTETALNYAASCTSCGARIGGGAGWRQSITITGTNFGSDPGVGNRSTSSNNIKIGTHQIASSNVTAWSTTSITFLTDSAVTGDTDADWGTNFGGANALTVTANSQTSVTGLNFYVFPQITSISGGVAADSAREYDAGDSDGVITLNGTRFGSSIGSGGVTILGSSGTTTSWNNTSITVQVPTAIADTTNTGNLIVTAGTGSNGKTNTYLNTIRILPRILSLSPTSGFENDAITVSGNHFCQSGTCPGSFSASDKVTFTSGIIATTFTSWSATAIVTAVPIGASTGNVFVTSATSYTSNTKSFSLSSKNTTLSTGTNPGNSTIPPGGAMTTVNGFTLTTNNGTDAITSITVNLSTNSGVGTLTITDNADTVLGSIGGGTGSGIVTGSNTISITSTNATIGGTSFKVKVTPLSHTAMPAPAGANYSITAVVTDWTGTNTKVGQATDTSSTVTIDNLSPGGTTGATATAGYNQVQVSWTNPGDADFGKVIIYCKTSTITEAPTEGTDPSVDATACDGTARVKYSGSTSPQVFTGLTTGTTYYFRIYARDTNGNFTAYASTQQVSGVPLSPTITTYTNSTETALNYAGACTSCGARIGGGAGYRQSITITGTNLGTVTAGNRSTATNNIKVGTHQIADANVTTWTDTSITFLTDTATTGDTDTDWGTNFGGTSALTVTSNSTTTTGLNFYVFPQITSVSTQSVADAAREYDAGDSDGVITLNGTRFGSSVGTGSVTIVGQSATTTAWSNTSITAQVPTAIADTTNTGNLLMTQGTGSNGKTNTYTTTGFRILPRITSLTPNTGIIGTAVTIAGNHLCQSGTCPGSFSAADKVTFTSGVVATTFTSWSATSIVTAVPTGAATGNVFVTSNTSYTSNNLNFTVAANTTTLATGSDPALNTIAPGASATDVNTFTFQTDGGTESISSVTVNLSTNSGVGTLAITDNANTILGSTSSPTTGSNTITVTGMSATTSLVTYKVRVTPLAHTSMPAPAGATYAITAPVTSWAGGNTHSGSDTNANALTIDNLSPGGTTGVALSPGDAQVQVSWTNPGDADFGKVIIYCKTSAITETPTEGSDPSVDGTACDATARVKYSGTASPQTFTGLTNGVTYYFRIYARDTNGNFTAYASTQQVSGTPTLTQVLTVGTVGTQATNLNSGTTAQHIGGGATAAFTLQINTGTSNVTSVKISDTGTVAMANLANPKLYYENATSAAACSYGGTESSVSGAAPVGETVTFTLPSVAVGVATNVTCLYFVSDVSSSASGGQTIDLQITNPSTDVAVSSGVNTDTVAKVISGTTTIKPQITGYTNSTETALNYAAACTSCGARIGGGAGFRQSITIPGYGFGADPGAANRSTATNNIKVGSHQIASSNVTAWSNTSITFLTDSATTGDTDADWGTNFGGATALTVTAGSQTVPTGLNFYIYPQITSITQPSGFGADSAREYDAGDSDGIITLNGTRFGSSLGSGSVTVLGSLATTNSWGNTAVVLQVPAAISDSLYTGSIVVAQGTGGNNKTNTYNTLRILPRITSLTPSSASAGEAITLNGNHFCQTGTCPGSFSASNKVTFTTATDATTFTSWSHTAVVTAVPTGAIDGNIIITSNSYTSNGSLFAYISSIPDDPTSMGQYEDTGFTMNIPTGDRANNPIYLKMSMRVDPSGSTLYPEVEYKPVGTAFTCTGTVACVSATTGTGAASPGPVNGYVSVSPADGNYHWQARVKHTRNSVDYYSNWVSYGGNAENVADFTIDTTGPVITAISSGTPGTNGATITWSTSGELSTSQIQWNTTGTFVDNCNTNNDCTIIKDVSPMVNSHSVSISNLNSGTLYYYRVRSKDAAGNETISTNNSFTTQIVVNPLKTIKSFISGAEGSINSATTYYFKVDAPETAVDVKSAYIEVSGLVSGGFSGTITINPNNSGAKNYEVSTGSGAPTLYKFIYDISSPNLETNLNLNDESPCTNGPGGGATCNKIILTPSTGSINILSAKVVTTYSYTP